MSLGRLSVQTDDGEIIAEVLGEPYRGGRHHPPLGWEIEVHQRPETMDDEQASERVVEEIERLQREARI